MSKQQDAIRDARALGVPKMLILGLQHMFAMFGATILGRWPDDMYEAYIGQ